MRLLDRVVWGFFGVCIFVTTLPLFGTRELGTCVPLMVLSAFCFYIASEPRDHS